MCIRDRFHPVTFAHELFGTVHHGELPADFLREKDYVPIVEHGRRKPPQPSEIPEVGRHGKPRISQVLRHGGRRISSALGQTHHVVRESPVLPGGMGAVGVGKDVYKRQTHQSESWVWRLAFSRV